MTDTTRRIASLNDAFRKSPLNRLRMDPSLSAARSPP